MALILLLETSAKNCSVALSSGGKIIASHEESNEQYLHAEKLHPFINRVFEEAGKSPGEIDAVAVSIGPGSYTGLRIGVSAAKGICYSLGKPLLAIDTTGLIASWGIQTHPGYTRYISMIDARRMEIYYAVYDQSGQKIEDVQPRIVDHSFFDTYGLTGTLYFGDAADKLKNIAPVGANLVHVLPSATMMADLSENAFRENKFSDVAYCEPFYLKEFVAGPAKSRPNI